MLINYFCLRDVKEKKYFNPFNFFKVWSYLMGEFNTVFPALLPVSDGVHFVFFLFMVVQCFTILPIKS